MSGQSIYDVLRELIHRCQWESEARRDEATAVINQAETLGLLGTLADTMRVQTHQHVWVGQSQTRYLGVQGGLGHTREYTTWTACTVCGEEQPGSRITTVTPMDPYDWRYRR